MLLLASLLILAAGAHSRPRPNQSNVPPELRVPSSQYRLLAARGKGDQIYECKSLEIGYRWTLKAPDARLFNHRRVIGRHFAGPTWQSFDGSTVTAKLAASDKLSGSAVHPLATAIGDRACRRRRDGRCGLYSTAEYKGWQTAERRM